MKEGKSRLCKGSVLVKTDSVELSSVININRLSRVTENSGGTSILDIKEGKSFRIVSNNKRDNGLLSWTINS